MKKKNFLRNLSTTALAICCLSSSLTLPSYASLEKDKDNAPLKPHVFSTFSYSSSAAFPKLERFSGGVGYSGWEQRDFSNKIVLEVIGPNEVAVSDILESDNGNVAIPKNCPSEYVIGGLPSEIQECLGDSTKDFEITKINSDVDFSKANVIALAVPDSVSTFDEFGNPGKPKVPFFYTYQPPEEQ